ncbi:MAG: aspartate aminotransferase family protein [Spirochaetes bacterium]|nr:MAG: aspartate aminotransferase family protein [Spirochaetota bacterium]
MKSNEISREQGDVNVSPLRKKYWERNFDKLTWKWFKEDEKYFLHQSLSTPVLQILKRTYGIYVEDLQGRRYIDMHGNGVHNTGFSNPEVIEAVKSALDEQLAFTPRRYTNIPIIKLAKKLAEITPGELSRSLFCPGGSEAIEMALALAKQVTGNYRTISYWDSFHGAGYAAASIGGEEHFKGGYGPMVPGAFHVDFPDYYRNPWKFDDPEEVNAECIRQIENVLKHEPGVAAIIGEPISSTPVIPTKSYWEGVKGLAEKYGALLIFDEIIEGLGRTGRMFASEHFVTPDILVLGKSLGGGLLPFAGIVTKDKYNILQHRSIGHFTHEKNPLCAVAALAEISYIEKNELVENANRVGEFSLNRLKEMKERHKLIGNVMGLGLHLGIDLVKDKRYKERAVKEAEMIMYICMEKGVAFKIIEGNVITLRPSLIINEEEMDFALSIIEEAIDMVEHGKLY